MLTSRSDAAVLGFLPDVILNVDPTGADGAVAIDFVTAGIEILLDFWHQFLHNGAATAKFRVRSHSRVSSLLS